MLSATVATDGESAELTLLSPNEMESSNNSDLTLEILESLAGSYGAAGISDWRAMTSSEAQLLQTVHTALGIADTRYY